MKFFHSLIGVLFFSVGPIFSFYITDDNSKSGYVSVQSTPRKYERRGLRGMQRRHFAGSTNHHNNENIVDSHFKVKKTPSHMQQQQQDNSRVLAPVRRWNTDPPIHQYTKQEKEVAEVTGRQQEPTVHGNQIGRSVDKSQNNQLLTVQRSNPVNSDYRAQIPVHPIRPNIQTLQMLYQENHPKRYETKPNFLQVNVRKTQVSTDPQKVVRLNNNQQITSISLHRPEEKYQKIPTSAVVDKTLQQVSAHNERNSPRMSRVLDDMAPKITDRKFKGEYRKRDTEYHTNGYDLNKINRNLISDAIRKYIVGKDKTINSERKSTREFSRIGSQEDSIEPEESPYAIFYRMHPDTLDEQEGFISMGSMEQNANMFTNKKKRLSVGYENEVDLRKTKKRLKKNSNAVRIHKKVKNYSNYRSL